MKFSDVNLFYAGAERVDNLRAVHEWRHADPGVYSNVTAMGGYDSDSELHNFRISTRGAGRNPRIVLWQGNIETWQEFNLILSQLESMTRTFLAKP